MAPADGYVEVPDVVGWSDAAALASNDSLGICVQGKQSNGLPFHGLPGTAVGQRRAAVDLTEPDEPGAVVFRRLCRHIAVGLLLAVSLMASSSCSMSVQSKEDGCLEDTIV